MLPQKFNLIYFSFGIIILIFLMICSEANFNLTLIFWHHYCIIDFKTFVSLNLLKDHSVYKSQCRDRDCFLFIVSYISKTLFIFRSHFTGYLNKGSKGTCLLENIFRSNISPFFSFIQRCWSQFMKIFHWF